MFDVLRAGATTLVQAAQEVADELRNQGELKGKAVQTAAADVIWLGPDGRIGLCGFPEKKLANEVIRHDRSLVAFESPSDLKYVIRSKFTEGDYLVWNLAGINYDYDALEGKIIEYNFPTRPMPPFEVVLEIVQAVRAWITESPTNIAIVHDVSGRRAAVIAACVLEALEYYPRGTALDFVRKEMGKAGDALVASQLRYFSYFSSYHWRQEGEVDLNKKLRIQRIIVNGIPDYTNENTLAGKEQQASCRPFVRIMDVHDAVLDSTIPPDRAVPSADLSFNIVPNNPIIVEKDILIRFFHAKPDGKEASMFGIALNMSFVNDVVVRFNANDLDGTFKNPRFPSDMFVDIVISEPDSDVLNYTSVIGGQTAPMEGTAISRPENDEVPAQEKVESANREASIDTQQIESTHEALLEESQSEQSPPVIVSPDKTFVGQENSVLREIEAALGDEEFADEDFDLSELNDLQEEED